MYASPVRITRHVSLLPLALLASWGLMVTPAAAQSDQATVGYLGNLNCYQTTSGSDVPILSLIDEATRGADNLGVAYGVFVMYSDWTYRAWGDYLYRGQVDDTWRLGAMINDPLFIYRPDPPSQPTEIDITTRGKTVQFVRVAIVLYEGDVGNFEPFPTVNRSGSGPFNEHTVITPWLRNYPWKIFLEELQAPSRRPPKPLSEAVFLGARRYNSLGPNEPDVSESADLIGYVEYKFTVQDLENPSPATQVLSAADVEAARTVSPNYSDQHQFRCSGNDSDYRGGLWLVRGPRPEMEKLLLRNSNFVNNRFVRRVYVMLTNQKDTAVTFTLTPIGELAEQDVVDERGYRELDPVTGVPLVAQRPTIMMVLGAGQSRVLSLDSPEDELLVYFNPPAPPEDAEFFAAPTLQPPLRVRHGDAYLITEAGADQWSNVHWWNEIPSEFLPSHVNDELARMRRRE